MNSEDRKFLEDALKSLTVDVVEELTNAMNILMKSNTSEDEQVHALEVITNFVADIDSANGESQNSFHHLQPSDDSSFQISTKSAASPSSCRA